MMSPSMTEKRKSLRLTLGGRSFRPMRRTSLIRVTTLSVWSMAADRLAAMNSAGWCAFNQAVW